MGATDLHEAAGMPTQTYSTSNNAKHVTQQSPAYANAYSVMDRSNIQQEVVPPQQPSSTNQQDSDMMRMFLPSEFVPNNFDEIFTHFGMNTFFANDDS
jgi:hypothetical protein